MSNFLNNLVARTLNLAPVVQPRLTSWFEPVGSVATVTPPDESAEVEGTSESQSTTTPEQHAPIAALKTRHPDREHSREDVRHMTVQHEHVQSREVVQSRVELIENTLLVPPPQRFRAHEIEHLPASEPPSRPAPRITPEQAVPPRETKPATVTTEPESWRKLQPRVQNLIDSRLNAVQPARTNDRIPEKTQATSVQPNVSRSIARNEVAPTASTPRAEPHLGFQPEPTETVNVTIGRVDVRAVFSAPQATAPAARARASTVNSLDDYLKQRSEGRR